ncbi:MAG TPA: hypothetical protein HPP65_02755 [Gammaproteobacteria bacterium]|jgi:hypothetical protein|nr:hypothetical protein [Gammaproteobacteria bacterium]MBT3717677.1 hypothetical protein [Gammaproteobacteria bacterium]MBT3845651.1 hypothetical protein [Gammaproteobacteria bacterium]MBT4299773.1 hypothetical protein [Gammaproteobacteria bacterium]MBT4548303.1 hypothetical protein [Gammaproteobacteria bacterium]
MAIEIQYQFDFGNERIERFDLQFDDRNFFLQTSSLESDPEPWMKLTFHQCEGCSLNESATPYCPVALNLAGLVAPFKEDFSHARVETIVTMRERQIVKQTDLQNSLKSMMGLVMATSGCPILDKFRPMAYTHQPFASMEETFFRVVSGYFLAQLVRLQHGEEHSFDLAGLRKIYSDINHINIAFTDRLRGMGGKDANLNALVSLDIFAQMGGFAIDDQWLKQLGPLFSGYIEQLENPE